MPWNGWLRYVCVALIAAGVGWGYGASYWPPAPEVEPVARDVLRTPAAIYRASPQAFPDLYENVRTVEMDCTRTQHTAVVNLHQPLFVDVPLCPKPTAGDVLWIDLHSSEQVPIVFAQSSGGFGASMGYALPTQTAGDGQIQQLTVTWDPTTQRWELLRIRTTDMFSFEN